MSEIVLSWSGPYEMSLETPKFFEGKSGLFAITHDIKIIYIGMAGRRNYVFSESRREGKMAKLLMEHRVLSGTKDDYDSFERAHKYVSKHCQRYVGIVSEEIQRSECLNTLLKNAENLLVYEVNKATQLYNAQLKDKYKVDRPFTVVNSGYRPADLKAQYSYRDIAENSRAVSKGQCAL